MEWWSPFILDFRMQISDLKALNFPVKNGYTQSAIINLACSRFLLCKGL
jgi:hypothetical protein